MSVHHYIACTSNMNLPMPWIARSYRTRPRIKKKNVKFGEFFLSTVSVVTLRDTMSAFFSTLREKKFSFASITYLRHTKRVACSRKSSHSFFPEPCFQRFRRTFFLKKRYWTEQCEKRLGVHIIVGFMSTYWYSGEAKKKRILWPYLQFTGDRWWKKKHFFPLT